MKVRFVLSMAVLVFALTVGSAIGQQELVKINFQTATAQVPDGYLADTGVVFGDRGNGFSYGWDLDATGGTRERNNAASQDKRYDTLNHMLRAAPDGPRFWEIAVPAGVYNLFIVCGDPSHTDQTNTLDVEGILVVDPDGQDNFDEYMLENVSVTDGRLTIKTAEGAANAKICFIDIYVADLTFNPAPVVDAKPDGTVALYKEETLQLGGTVTDEDPIEGDPGVLSWEWSQGSGPGVATFSDVSVLDPTVTFSAKGNYQLVLTATDGDKDANDIVNVIVLDHADDKMIAHWEFDVVGGAFDVMDSVHDNHGTFVSADGNSLPEYVAGWIGSGALSLPGDSHVLVSIDANSVPTFNNEPRTGASISAWIKVDTFDAAWQNVVSRGDNSWRLARSSRGDDSGNSMAFHVSGVSTTPGNGPSGRIGVNDGYWHHVAGTYDGKAITLYIDGVLDVTQPATGLIAQSTYPIWIGANAQTDPSRYWKGLIDDLRVYNYGLSEAEVLALTGMGQVAPMVNAGADQALQYRPGEKVSLTGMVADNGIPSPLSISWSTESAPDGDAIFDDASSPVTEVTFPTFGVYVLALTAENDYAKVTDTVQITVISPTCADVIAEGKLMVGDLSGPDGTPDCRVDLYDFVRMAEDWMRCNDPGAVECEYPY